MAKKTQKPPASLDMPFAEALARFARTDPRELAEAIAQDVLRDREKVEAHIEDVRREIKDGARPKKGRFRL